MNASINCSSSSDKQTCEGKCILEMEKILEPSVIVEFLTVVRDFHNDDKTATKLKLSLTSETSEAVKVLKERASEMILAIDEMFLNRRQRQSSFYRLCHRLARTASPEGAHLPDESKCICFSEENLRKFNVDLDPNTSLDFSSNVASIKEALKQCCGELRCTDCGKYLQLSPSPNTMSCISDCSCSSPSVTSQHKVHEAILKLCQDDKSNHDSWYLTHLKRDADYYTNRHRKSSVSSDETVNSFEIISSSDERNFLKIDATDVESFDCDLDIQQEMLTEASDKSLEPLQNPKSLSLSFSCPKSSSEDIQNLSKNLNEKLLHTFSSSTNLSDARKTRETENTTKKPSKSPAAVLRQSFSPYFNKCAQSSNKGVLSVCPAECLRRRLQKLQVDSKPDAFGNRASDPSRKTPSDSLKCALNSYFKTEASGNWLRY